MQRSHRPTKLKTPLQRERRRRGAEDRRVVSRQVVEIDSRRSRVPHTLFGVDAAGAEDVKPDVLERLGKSADGFPTAPTPVDGLSYAIAIKSSCCPATAGPSSRLIDSRLK